MSFAEAFAAMQKVAAAKKTPPAPVAPAPAPVAAPAYQFPEKWRIPTDNKGQHELHLWNQWKTSGEDPQHLSPLLQSLQPLIHHRLRTFAGRVPIQDTTLHAKATNLVIAGLRKFDPSRAQMKTLLTNELRGMRRFVVQHQNMSRITEDRASKIGDLQRARESLNETLSRPPTTQEVADHMKTSVKTITKLEQEMRDDLLASGAMEDPFIEETPRSREVLALIPFELNPTEMAVFELLTGYGGKQKLKSTGAIAKKLGWADSKVSQTKNSIAVKMRKYL